MAASEESIQAAPRAVLVAVAMGYGHLRAAHALADELGREVLECDRPPLASAGEQRRWRRTRGAYELISRSLETPLAGPALRRLLEFITFIPQSYPARDLSAPNLGVRLLERLARRGFGAELLGYLERRQATLLTTFYAPAVIADLRGFPRIVSVVTDSDLNRIWAQRFPFRTSIRYCVPSERAVSRLRSYGVPRERIHLTGFPLPPQLLGGPDLVVLRRNLAARLVRLDPRGAFRGQARAELAHFLGTLPDAEEGRPPLLTFAVGGAGAQLGIVRRFLPSLHGPVTQGLLRLALVAGARRDVARRLERWVRELGLDDHLGRGLEIVCEDGFAAYYNRFNEVLAETDILWSKPSEMTFYGALGIPLVFSPPVGTHERHNRRWALHRGAGFKQENPALAWGWLREWLEEGTLAAAAWSAYQRLPKFGTYRIAEVLAEAAAKDK
jgi:hypothetical protein